MQTSKTHMWVGGNKEMIELKQTVNGREISLEILTEEEAQGVAQAIRIAAARTNNPKVIQAFHRLCNLDKEIEKNKIWFRGDVKHG